jgi:cell wall-associated NlpC family hydrolase
MKRQGIARFAILGMLAGSLWNVTSVYADVIQEQTQKIQQLQSSLDVVNQQIGQASRAEAQAEARAADLQRSIEEVRRQMDENAQQIAEKTNEIHTIDRQIRQNEAKLAQLQGVFDKQMRVLYEYGSVSYLSVLLNAKSFDDFLTRFDAIRLIADADKQLVDQMKSLKQQLVQQQQQVQQDLQVTQEKQQELALLEQTDRNLQQQQMEQATAFKNRIDEAQQNAAQIQAEIAFARQELLNAQEHPIADAPVAAGNGTQALQGTVGELISYAESFMGTPYVWGGDSPGGFDCSGFTQYVFGHFGISLYRTSQSQFLQGVGVSRGDLRPGDLVFFSTYGPGATHVGIYIGSGLMINAEDYGVRIDNINDSYWSPIYIGARRIIQE